ncbi:MAG: glycosyltransferase family 9 protein [Planctomycetota bacterium]|nr:glycosyltransferase family 9 protein [Planctomycetota bacterium]
MNLGLSKRLDRVVGGLMGWCIGVFDRWRDAVAPRPPVDAVRHVLLVKFWGLGNWALLRPIIRDLRARFPAARFTIVTLAGNAPLVEDLAEHHHLVSARSVLRTLRDLLGVVRALRRDPPDLALDFEQFARTGALLARAAGARQRVGFRTGGAAREHLYTVTVPWREDAHAARSFRDLAEAGGLEPGPYEPGGLAPSQAGRIELATIGLTTPCVVLHPGSGDNFPGRRWSAQGFAALGRAALEAGRSVYVTGTAAEAELVARTVGAIGPRARDLAGALTLPALIALLAEADVLASNDTGPVHLASQLGTPVLAFYGPNTPVLYGPLSARSRALYRNLPCSPCITVANYRSSRCRIYSCMESIATGEAVSALRAILAGRAVEARS